MDIPASISRTDFSFPGQTGTYKGKVRDIYFFGNKLAMVVSDRVSAFDIIMPRAIPFKGQILNRIAERNLKGVKHIVPTWLESNPDPNVSFGKRCKPIPIEMVIRGYLAGHSWREYSSGKRKLCGVEMPDGMKESQAFPSPIITPATKAEEGHDEDISREEILEREIVDENILNKLEEYTYALYQYGQEEASKRDLILVDTKYEFGFLNDEIYLMDEIHTPDSSRYYYKKGYRENLERDGKQKQLSKEFLREWLISEGFQGLDGQIVPEMDDERVMVISNRYVELYETLMGEEFSPTISNSPKERVEKNLLKFLEG